MLQILNRQPTFSISTPGVDVYTWLVVPPRLLLLESSDEQAGVKPGTTCMRKTHYRRSALWQSLDPENTSGDDLRGRGGDVLRRRISGSSCLRIRMQFPGPISHRVGAFFVKTTFQLGKVWRPILASPNIMPPGRYSSQYVFNIEMLNPRTLYRSGGPSAALREIESICYRGDPGTAKMVEALGSRPYLLEYIISGTLSASVRLCTLPTLIILSSSVGGGRI